MNCLVHTAKPSTERRKRHDGRSDGFTILDPEKGPKKQFQTDPLSTNGLPQKQARRHHPMTVYELESSDHHSTDKTDLEESQTRIRTMIKGFLYEH